MGVSLYPRHEHGCPHASHSPHLGGAALGTSVPLANEQELSRRAMHGTIDAERAREDRLFAENEPLRKEKDQVKLELRLARQNKFATGQQKLTTAGSNDFAFFEANREFVRTGCRFHRRRSNGELTEAQQTSEKIEA